jgi:two-component system, NarL family, response regulator DevR
VTYILLVEDNVSFAGKFARLLEAFPGLEIEVVTVGSLAEARERLTEGGLDAALVDLELQDGDGLTLIREMSAAVPRVQSLAVTALMEEETLALVSEGGAVGLVDKLGSLELIAEAIKRQWDEYLLRMIKLAQDAHWMWVQTVV